MCLKTEFVVKVEAYGKKEKKHSHCAGEKSLKFMYTEITTTNFNLLTVRNF